MQVADYFVDTIALEAFTNLLGKRLLGAAFFNGCQESQGDAKANDCMPLRYEGFKFLLLSCSRWLFLSHFTVPLALWTSSLSSMCLIERHI
jgi:hypothetical protein